MRYRVINNNYGLQQIQTHLMSLSTLENTNHYIEHTVLRFMCIDSYIPLY